jgi:WD40 repeat protein
MKGTKVLLYKDKLTGHKESIVGLHSPQGPKGGILVSVSRDGRLKVWNLFERDFILKRCLLKNAKSPEDVGQKIDHSSMDMIESCLFSDKTVFCGYADGSICAWNMKVDIVKLGRQPGLSL